MIMPMPDIQKSRSPEPPPHRTTEDVQPIGLDSPFFSMEAPPVRRLDGEVTRTRDMAFSRGTHCEVWVGRWVKGGRMEGGEGDVEKVRPHLIMSTPLT